MGLLNDVNNLLVPQVNVSSLRTLSNELKSEAFRLGNKSKSLLETADYLRNSIEEKSTDGRELLDTALEQQEDIEGLKNDIVFCGSQANKTVQLWNEILERAEGNFQLITGRFFN